ncbi:MAG: hypothetical protein Q8Q82_00445, partial [Hydrogenophaga sp.]|nr:hypothetical protein [Hydrogenophaga sp.]
MDTPRSAFGASPQGAAPAARQSRFRGASGWFNPRDRLRTWWHNRLPRLDTLTLTQRNVYILPTRPGWMLALTLLLLLVASINYQLNLGYLLTFLLAGSAVVGMHVCHGNLRGTTLHLNPPDPVHAGQAAALDIRLSSERRSIRYGIGMGVIGADLAHAPLAWTDVPAQGSTTLQVSWPVPGRGLHTLPALPALTLFPLGTYALPESQLDRFHMRLSIGYPDRAAERELLRGQDRRD